MPWVPGLTVRVLTHERAQVGQQRIVDALFEVVRHHKLAGMTVTHAFEGTSRHGGMRAPHIVELGEDPPIVVEIVDRTERIEPVLPQIAALVTSGVLTVSDARLYFPASALSVQDIMQQPRLVVRPDTPIADVLPTLLDDGIRLVPVAAENDLLVGVVTLGHLLRAADPALGAHLVEARGTSEHIRAHLDRLIQGRAVREVMISEPYTLTPTLTLEEAVGAMTRHHITRAPVVDASRHLVGLISERMLVAALVAPVMKSAGLDAGIMRAEDAELSGALRRGVHPSAGEPLTAGLLADRTVPIVSESAPWEEVVDAVQTSASCLILVVTPERRLRGLIDEQTLLERAIPGTNANLGRALRRTLLRSPGQVFGALRGLSARPLIAAELLRAAPLVMPESEPLADALVQMVQADQAELAVVIDEAQQPLGVLKRNEALRALVSG